MVGEFLDPNCWRQAELREPVQGEPETEPGEPKTKRKTEREPKTEPGEPRR